MNGGRVREFWDGVDGILRSFLKAYFFAHLCDQLETPWQSVFYRRPDGIVLRAYVDTLDRASAVSISYPEAPVAQADSDLAFLDVAHFADADMEARRPTNLQTRADYLATFDWYRQLLESRVASWLRDDQPDGWEPALRKQCRWFDAKDVDDTVALWRGRLAARR
jgi:hypothetical protein